MERPDINATACCAGCTRYELPLFTAGTVDPATFFGGVYVISLTRTPDRLAAFGTTFPSGAAWPFIAPEHWPAFDGMAAPATNTTANL